MHMANHTSNTEYTHAHIAIPVNSNSHVLLPPHWLNHHTLIPVYHMGIIGVEIKKDIYIVFIYSINI